MTDDTVGAASAADIPRTDSERLIKAYGILFVGGILLLSAVGAGFGILQAKQISDRLTREAIGQAELLHKGLQHQLDEAQQHVDGMRFVMETLLERTELSSGGSMSEVLERLGQGSPAGAPWDTLPPELRSTTGTLYVRRNATEYQRELDDMLTTLPLMWNAHKKFPNLQWSYYYDAAGAFSVLYPGLDFKALSGATGKHTMDEILDVVFAAGGTYPVKLIGPDQNPDRQLAWTPPYPDAAAAGLMVSLVAPVYHSDEFVGVFGSDLTLAVLNEQLKVDDTAIANFWVLAEGGQVVAASRPPQDMSSRILNLSEVLDPLQIETVFSISPNELQRSDHGVWKTFDLQGTPWRMLLYIAKEDLRSSVFELMTPYLAMMSLCVASLIGLVVLQHRRFTLPALQLARHVENLPHKVRIQSPVVPRHWKSLFGRANTTELERREAIHKLQDVNADLEDRVAERARELTQANAELSRTVAELKEAQSQLVKSEKLAGLGSLVAGVAHELNTPIGNAVMMASTLVDRSRDFQKVVHQPLEQEALLEFAEVVDNGNQLILRNLSKADELVASFKQVAVDQTSYKRRVFSFSEIVKEIGVTLGPSLEKAHVIVETTIKADAEMDSYPGPVGQVLLNLYNNALVHAFPPEKSGVIKVHSVADGSHLTLTVADNGMGIPEETIGKIFDPFFTTKLGMGGSGLGLHIVYNLVTELLGGKIDVESKAGEGTTFKIVLPLVAPKRPTEDV
ncbi:ATP-binding protein [Roseibium sp.]|uniref:ATP-binding protein n=1 Tax=Roseibium sp. TaxID=1936156 RepID=UPI003BAECBDC